MNKQLVRSLTFGGLAAIAIAMASHSLAQSTPQSSTPWPRYNTATETTLTGSVEAVLNPTNPNGRAGTHLTLKTDKESLDVHVGPSWYLAEKQITFAKGDQITVTGSRVKFDSGDALIAREIKKGQQTISLRDPQGFPLWSGGAGRRP